MDESEVAGEGAHLQTYLVTDIVSVIGSNPEKSTATFAGEGDETQMPTAPEE